MAEGYAKEADQDPEEETWTGPPREDVQDLWSQLRAVWGPRNGEYQQSRQFYYGEHWNAENNPKPRNRYALTVNYLQPFADKDVQLLMGQLPGIQVLPPGSDDPARRFAEDLEGVLYGNWKMNKAHDVFLKVAWNSIVLRRGILYYWWDAEKGHPCFKSCSPDNFYPVYDGETIVEAIYVSRRLTRSLKRAYPHLADQIVSDEGMEHVFDSNTDWSRVGGGITDALGDTGSSAENRAATLGYTTVVDYYDKDGAWVRLMGDAEHRQNLGYGFDEVPFIEFTNTIQGDEREPRNAIDTLAELNQYYNIVLSQRGDVIKKWANPPIIDKGTGVSPAIIKQTLAGDGGILPVNPRGSLELLEWRGTMPEISEQLEEVKEAMYDLSGKPRSAFGQTITNQSGVMTNLALTPTLQSNELRETLWGNGLSTLCSRILRLYESFSSGGEISFRGTKQGKTPKSSTFFEVSIAGKDINGWDQVRMKWPSAIRVDDPAFIQSELAKLQSKPQSQSIYDTLENLGVEDVEAAIDRIRSEHEDPRIHPEILEQTINSLAGLGGQLAPDAADVGAGLGAGLGGPPMDEAAFNEGMIQSGVPVTADSA